MRARATRTYEVTAGTTRVGVIFGGGSIGNDGARATIGNREWKQDGSDSGTGAGADDVSRVTIGAIGGTATGAAIATDEGSTRDATGMIGDVSRAMIGARAKVATI